MKSRTGEKSPGNKRPRRPSNSKTIPTDADLIASGFAPRKFEREYQICETAEQVLRALCRYKRVPHYQWTVCPAKQHAVDGRRLQDMSLLTINLASPMRWYNDIYKNGLAAASGCFVLEVIKKQPDGSLIVIAVKQGRGCGVKLAYAIARLHAGAWRLEWKGLPVEFKVRPANPGIVIDNDYYDFMIAKKILDATAGIYSEPENVE